MDMINVFQPDLGAEELSAVQRVFESNWVGKGEVTDRFESAFAGHLETPRELIRSANSCTELLFLAMPLLEIGPGDEVVLPSISFVGAANAIVSCGARPVFCDVDAASLNATAASIEACMGPRTKAVMILHYGGVPCDMESICELVALRGVALIEDSACSVASRYRGRACGTFGDVSAWSFDSSKIVVAGDGGMVRCRTPEMAQSAGRLLYLGMDRASGYSNPKETRWWEFDVKCCGRRGILNDIASAIGIEQLNKLPGFLAARRQVHEFYDRELSGLEWLSCPPPVPEGSESSYYFYWIQVPADARDRLAIHLRKDGVYTTFRYLPLHRVPFYDAGARLPHAESAAARTLCIPLHASLSASDLDRVVTSIRRFDAVGA